jgi:hypothetical protein
MDSNIALSNSLQTKVKMTVLRKGRDIFGKKSWLKAATTCPQNAAECKTFCMLTECLAIDDICMPDGAAT